ncbi:gliding motility-associated C-terminal domain-containing protein [Paracrocinitomix mangrovi]|uniref:T9SS type B sorting domain-containing protein n=1 Tax=Paracrocinitomix mangrovi TaxID=2862509 RepID=UPI001C8DD6FF|nr:gliding motility-associated C-terminal domain-containing protein [Paracrocinitomix mangrovi]UKN00638.1 gliding motility-associated C-terminal domain-containing protein [Paracrocinitomix mangrovi]
MKSISNYSNGLVCAISPLYKNHRLNAIITNFKLGLSILIFSLICCVNSTYATHVVGGGITYSQLENNNYLITVKLYRDCSQGTAQLPGNVNVQCRRGDGSVPAGYSSLVLPQVSVTTLNPAVPACAFDPGICVSEGVYQDIVNIPPGAGGYHLYYNICCRNGTIGNIVNPLNAEETFYAYIPDNSTLSSAENSSPYFLDNPPVYVCAGQPLDLSFMAYDIDGDSLDYYFYTPFDGQNNGGITYGPGMPPNNINISPVTWQAGFGATDPLDAAPGLLPGLTIDNNGLINGVPTAPGQYVVGVMVDEYRNGVLIGRISRDFQFNVINCPPPIQAMIDVPNVCNGLNVTFDNLSTGIFNDQWWDFGTANPADTSHAFEPNFAYNAPGTYDVTLIVQPGTECADTITYSLTIQDPVNFNLTVDSISCNGLSDGQANASATDLTYTYDWSTMQSGSSIQNLAIGNYWVYATNTIGCTDTQFFNVYQPNTLDVQFVQNDPLCYGDNTGSIQALANGGTAPYTYHWTVQNQFGDVLNNIGDGYYHLEVTDANGCVLNDGASLNEPPQLTAIPVVVNNVSCHGLNDGAVNVNINGGTPAYAIDWLTLPNDNTYMDNLAPGNYIAEVTDANGCLSIVNTQITEPDSFFVDIVIINQETCTGSNGAAFADVTNGIGNINFIWAPGSQTTDFINGLSAGPIQVMVQDENGCTDQANATIIDQPTGSAVAGNIVPVSCQNGNDGQFEVLMNGGTAPFNYEWSFNAPNQNTAVNLSAGYYWVAVTDNNGCVDTLDFSINELPPLEVQPIMVLGPLCNGDSNGEAQAEAIGGTAPYNFSWNTMPIQNVDHATGLANGFYTVTVTDANNCQAQMTVEIVEPQALVADIQVLGNNICFGDSAGVALGQGVGGTAPYTYFWVETGETTALIGQLPAGNYNLQLTDANGCTAANNIDIVQYDSVVAEVIFDEGFCPGDEVDFYVQTNGLNNQYDYYWFVDHNLQGTSNTFTYPINDTSVVAIVLVNIGNCPSVVDSVTVGPIMMQPNNVTAFASPDTLCYGLNTELAATVQDTSYITSISWNHPDLTGLGVHSVSPTSTTDYIITIENVCGEQQSDVVTVNVFEPPYAQANVYGLTGCESIDVMFDYTYDQQYVYSLQNVAWEILNEQYNEDSPTLNFTLSAQANATLYLTFSNGCTFEYDTSFATTVYPNPDADFYYNPDPALENEITEFIDISYGNTQYWEWYVDGQFISNDERPTHVFDAAGFYNVMQIVEDENGCIDTMKHEVEVIGNYLIYVPNAFTPDGDGANNTFKPVVSNIETDNYVFQIFNRWGEKIFETTVIEDAWDGTLEGESVRDGVYVWKVKFTDNQGTEHERYGHVTLLK